MSISPQTPPGRARPAPSVPIRVVVVDDHRLTASSIGDALERHGMVTVSRAYSAREAVDAVNQHRPDVLVIDLDLGPGPTGIDVAVEVREKFRRIGIVLLTAFEDPRLLDSRLPDLPPASVYMVKQHLEGTIDVVKAVRSSLELINSPRPSPGKRSRVALTDSQVEILRLVAGGLSNQAIATQLSLTASAVEKSVSRLGKKLGIETMEGTNSRVKLTHRYLDMVGYVRD